MTIALRDAREIERDSTVTAVLGPTNTGKTHYAIERMLAYPSGVIGFPLRLLAREVYDRVVALRGPRSAALITGEEKISPPDAQYTICTVESMPLDWGAAFVAVDEIQLCADPERGHVFTDRLLRARGRDETLFLGADTIRPRLAQLIPKAKIISRPRLSTLSYAGSKKLSRLPRRSAVVAFSVDSVYAIAELMRRQKGGVAVVMGALSPRTRNAQVELYQNGDVEHLVATDAIGMGLNLDLHHVAFAGLAKFDGRRHRGLSPQEMAQIAGRAGRHVTDGTWGVTGEAAIPDPDTIEQIANGRFEPLGRLSWRNARLDFRSVPALLRSLDTPAPHAALMRGRDADDTAALRVLWDDPETQSMAKGGAQVRLLWEVCQTPDFRKTALSDHTGLLARIYRFLLSDAGVIPTPWFEAQVARVDRTDGDIDTLSKRLAFVRTWTYVANRNRWLDDPAGWRERTRLIEDRLSDALHDRLTKRFVDRRTSVLMQRLKQKERLVAEVSDTGEVTVEGHVLGKLEGFRFRPDPTADGDELRTLRAASQQALQAHMAHRADRFYNAPDTEIDVTEQGGLMWGSDAVGRLAPGADILSPTVVPFVDDGIDAAVAERVGRRLTHWIERRIKTHFEPLLALRDDATVTGLARGVGFQLSEALGILPRRVVANDVKQLDQEARGALRKHGVRFGQHHVYMPILLKPAPTRFRLLLWALKEQLEEFPAPPPPGLVTIPAIADAPEGFYQRAGYRLAGARALRIDMLERLSDMLRAADGRAGFEASADMLSITGCSLEQFADLMQGLGYTAEKGERHKAPRSPKVGDTPISASADTQNPAAQIEADAATGEVSECTPTEGNPADAESSVVSAPDAPETDAPPQPVAQDLSAHQQPLTQATRQGTDGTEASETAPEPGEAAPIATEEGAVASGVPAPGEAEPQIETFFVFRQAPRRNNRPARSRHGGNGRTAPASAVAAQDAGRPSRTANPGDAGDQPRRGKKTPHNGSGKRPDKGKPRGGKPARDESSRVFRAAPKDDRKAADPDNPFAVLKQLKDRL